MSPFTVDWDPDAEDELARIWMQDSDPPAITRASAQADQSLARDPLGNGRHVSGGLYQITAAPLLISFTINVPNRHVQVTWVRRLP